MNVNYRIDRLNEPQISPPFNVKLLDRRDKDNDMHTDLTVVRKANRAVPVRNIYEGESDQKP